MKKYLQGIKNESERLSRDSEVKYIKMMMRSNKVDYSSSPIQGGYDETVRFDYMVGNYTLRNHLVENIIPYLCMM